MKAPFTLIFTDPGCMIASSISAVLVLVLIPEVGVVVDASVSMDSSCNWEGSTDMVENYGEGVCTLGIWVIYS